MDYAFYYLRFGGAGRIKGGMGAVARRTLKRTVASVETLGATAGGLVLVGRVGGRAALKASLPSGARPLVMKAPAAVALGGPLLLRELQVHKNAGSHQT